MWDHIIQDECGHPLYPGEILCSALDWDPLRTIGYWIIGEDYALKNECLGKADELTHWATHVKPHGWHLRPQFHHSSLYKAM